MAVVPEKNLDSTTRFPLRIAAGIISALSAATMICSHELQEPGITNPNL
jgi:hypothetical protein